MTFQNKYWEWQAKRERKKEFAKYRQVFCIPYSAKKLKVRGYRRLIDLLTDIEFFLLGLCLVIEAVKVLGGWYCD